MGYVNKIDIDNDPFLIEPTLYGTCGTAASTGIKDVSLTSFALILGVQIAVKFTVTNTAAVEDLKLRVNSTAAEDAKPIKYRGANLSEKGTLAAGRIYSFVYDGTNWELVGDINTDTNTVQRTFRSSSDVELPIAGINASNSATSTYNTSSSISSGSYASMYAAIPNTVANLATINPSTGKITVPGGVVANITGNVSGTAGSLTNNFILKINTGEAEGTSLYTYNGSVTKTLDIISGNNITLSTATGQVTISSTNNYREIQVDSTEFLDEDTTTKINLIGGSNITLTPDASNGNVTISASIPTYSAFNASGVNHSSGLVPDPGATEGNTRFLCEDATWKIVSTSDVNVTQTLDNTSTSEFPLLFSTSNNSTTTTSVTSTAKRNNDVYIKPSTGTLYATAFSGNLNATDINSGIMELTYLKKGSADTALMGKGNSTAPGYVSVNPSVSITDGTNSNAPKINITVLGVTGSTAAELNKASTSIYGATKLSAAADDASLAATAKSVYDLTTTVNSLIATADALVFKGTLSGAADTTYTPAANCGWTYKVDADGLINGERVEIGDILICTADNTDAATSSNVSTIKSKWVIIQNNVDGAIFRSENLFVDKHIIVADGTSGKVKDTPFIIDFTLTNDALSAGSISPTVTSVATLGTSSYKWNNIYSNQAQIGGLTIGGTSTAQYRITSSDALCLNRNANNSVIFQSGGTAKVYLDKDNNFRPAENNTQSIGTTDYYWANMYATTFNGALAGNADTATQVKVTGVSLPSSGTSIYYLTYAGSTTTGNQDIKDCARLYLFENTTASYLNIGSASTSGGITVHNANGKYSDIVSSAFSANRTLTLPDQTGTIALLTKTDINALINLLDTGTSVLTGDDYIITQYVGGGTTTTTYHRRMAKNVRVGGLTTARSLWGNSFDGTADISGNFVMKNNSSRYHRFTVKQNGTDNTVGEMYYDSGNVTNVTSGRWRWEEWSPNSTNNTTTTGYYEVYSLPIVNTGLTANASYDILTSKDLSFSITGNASTATQVKVTSTSLPSSSSNTYYLTYSGSTTTGNQDIKNGARLYLYESTTATWLCIGSSSTTGGLTLRNANGKYVDIVTSAFEANRTLTVPDATGTICLTNGTGASGTWGISISGNAATATRINGNLANATTDVNRNIWVSSGAGADGIPNYVSSFYFNPSTKEFGVPSGTRIYPQQGALYLGNSGNQSWVYVQDMASQDSQKWKLHTSGAMETIGRIWIQGGSEAGSDTNRLTTTSGMPGNMQYNQSRRGTQIYANGIAFADPYNGNSNSDAGWIRHLETTGNSGTLEIAVGDDGNEIIAARQYKTDNTINRELTLLDASGNTTVPGKLYFKGDGIYHIGSAATQRIIRIIDSGDQYGTGVSIGAGGLALFGGGESTSTLISSLSLTAGGTESTYISSDGTIYFYPNQNSYDASSSIYMSNGSIVAGVLDNTTRENTIQVRSGAGCIYMYSQASATGSRGIYLLAHGSGSAKGIVTVDTNNNATFTGSLSGNASTATNVAWTGITSNPGIYTNDVSGSSYGNVKITTAKGGYYGFLVGTSTSCMNVMSSGQHNGLYCQAKGRWMFYYDSTNDRCAIGSSSTTANYILTVGGDTYINGNLKGNNTKTIGTTAIADHWNKLYLGGSTTGSNAINSANPLIEFSDSDRSQYGQLIYTDFDAVRAPDGLTWVGNQANSWFQAPRVFGAVWNDYAEYRETKEEIQPGRCVVETGNGDLVLSTERLQGGCEIVSDTFGFAIGYTKTCKTPTACAGRVLAYLYEDNSLAKPGDPVCSGPNGTVSLMTHEEEIEWPSRIIATVSEIPTYDEWEYGSADEFGVKEKLKVNGRIWIRIR